ncbi:MULTISPECIES: ubiquinol-cytochrome c reductase iron-sulfur subunit [unclassified Paenibacillus]|uniref:ubiquinol-cytochrome c reductase iron-sulfur subunit n=1 Tax=unclassified Paenibacillus TaxID=185978 RepID=UPI001EF9C29B|nr:MULTISPECIES: ubiquinol-cytochrome c reductase iron-sulfur subunit [unclassified Paenibacillus]CAH0118771.1 Cytochrome b6-f complex iron-sulfur subunit [Paenibacillus sp. CECT 9249]
MSNHNEHEETTNHGGLTRKEISRRQFLTYTLGGATAFMAGGAVIPMIRFAVDPLLQKKDTGAFVKVAEESKITEEPTEFTFQKHQVDGWYESDPTFSAYIARDSKGEIFALSPICQHLGCTVGWNSDKKFPNEYHCPCHGAHYTKDGKQLAVARGPLKQYDIRIENGWVYLGDIIENTRVK